MTLLLTLEQAPHPQAVRQMRLDEGELVIGRGAEADWRIEDPDSYVSRRHCTVSGRAGRFIVTDTSSGGLFVGNVGRPLGNGNSAALQDGVLLRLGDYVLRASIAAQAEAGPPPPARSGDPFDVDGFFSSAPEAVPRAPRPADLPDPFDAPVRAPQADARPAPPLFDDPFTLDPVPTAGSEPASSLGGFDWDAPPMPEPSRPGAPPPARMPEWAGLPPASPDAPPGDERSSTGADLALAAFLKGLGVGSADVPAGDPVARLEALGRDYRLMVVGLMQLLRMRASERSNARVARTVLGPTANNPLKVMPSVEDALAMMLAPRSAGFSDAEGAITGAIRDLADHQVSSWRGIQTALRRMVDRFDPKLVEAELDRLGLLETLLAGGRRARLWELYEKRFREIAESAERRFLGEVGSDFREAYEKEDK
jgi:type VI secretion system protein ImpI